MRRWSWTWPASRGWTSGSAGKIYGIVPEVVPHPKPRKRITDRKAGRDKLRAERECRCGCGRDATDRAHLVPRDLGGDDVDENIIPLAHVCHMRVEHHEPGWRDVAARVRAGLSPDERHYAIEKKGDAFLDRYWPA